MSATGIWVRKYDLSTGSDPMTLVLVEGTDRRKIVLDHFPFTVGRLKDRDLVLTDPRVSREHAVFMRENDGVYIEDRNSRQGTFVNNERTTRRKLTRNDRLEFGIQGASFVLFNPDRSDSSIAQQFISQFSSWKPSTGTGSDLEMLNVFLEAARKLNNTNVLEDVLQTLLEASLRLTKAERGFVFLRDLSSGELKMVAGRDKDGVAIHDDTTISKSALREAATSASEFLVTDTSQSEKILNRESVVAQNLKSIICIPLRRAGIQGKPAEATKANTADLLGVMYLDSHFLSGKLSLVSQDILRTIANGAAALVENAALVEAEEAARRVQQEMAIAAQIQQGLMTVTVPEVPYAKVNAVSYACKDIGGDFFDLVCTEQGLSLIVADVSGKGVSAAVVASILQGMLYSHLAEDTDLAEMLGTVNRFLFEKIGGQKYATLVIARISPGGEVELMNCGHVPPLVVSNGSVQRLEDGNLPVGLIPIAKFSSARHQLKPGDRLVVVTDGVTEAENSDGEFFGNERLDNCCSDGLDGIVKAVSTFRGSVPLSDDCTVTEIVYRGTN
ncbi:MAG TPA: SpoIIE family protein phosphatase [Candidatus Binatia bacterium]|jgi:serine phosphatase RsbU (regulator of sigma subunit)/pSer/pThr/pTyr-binding forkhead associated (FHA) protein|nr:SpoIIE family protein phosphatase [Candidatus Binatia bacterium]